MLCFDIKAGLFFYQYASDNITHSTHPIRIQVVAANSCFHHSLYNIIMRFNMQISVFFYCLTHFASKKKNVFTIQKNAP